MSKFRSAHHPPPYRALVAALGVLWGGAALAGQPSGVPYGNAAAVPTQPTSGNSVFINGNVVWLDATGLHQMTPSGTILTFAPTSTANVVTNSASGGVLINDATNQPVSNN